MYLIQVAKAIYPKLKMYLSQIAKSIFLKIQNAFVSLCEPSNCTLRCYTSICDGIISTIIYILTRNYNYTCCSNSVASGKCHPWVWVPMSMQNFCSFFLSFSLSSNTFAKIAALTWITGVHIFRYERKNNQFEELPLHRQLDFHWA